MNTIMMILIVACFIMNLITMILVIVSMKRNKLVSYIKEQNAAAQVAPAAEEAGVVFCRNCGNPYDSTIKVCPSCKTPR